MTYYAKLWTDILGDEKLMRAARKGAKHLVLLPWLIAFAKKADDEGRLTVGGEAAEPDDIAAMVPGVTTRQVAASFDALERIGVLTRGDDGILAFEKWRKRNWMAPSDTADQTRDRKRKERDRHRESHDPGHEDSHDHVTTARSRDVDKDKDRDLDEDKDACTAGASASEFDRAWSEYPRRAGGNSRHDAALAWDARIREGASALDMIAGTIRYRHYCEHEEQIGTRFVMQAKRFFGAAKHYDEPWSTSDDELSESAKAAIAARDDDGAEQRWLEERKRERGLVPAGNGVTPT